jgi:phage nucleotide-binding protein
MVTKSGLKFLRVGEAGMAPLLKAFIYGDSGSGKTFTASSAPNPLFLLTESNGLKSIHTSNPNALVAQCNTIHEVRQFVAAASRGELPDEVETIVIDSLTEVQRLFIDEILDSKGHDKDNKMQYQDWNTMTNRMLKFVRCVRDLPYHVVVTSLAQYAHEEDGTVARVFPSFQGQKLANEISQFFNLVGYVMRKEVTDADGVTSVRRAVLVEGPNRFLVKPCHPLVGALGSDVSQWIEEFSK